MNPHDHWHAVKIHLVNITFLIFSPPPPRHATQWSSLSDHQTRAGPGSCLAPNRPSSGSQRRQRSDVAIASPSPWVQDFRDESSDFSWCYVNMMWTHAPRDQGWINSEIVHCEEIIKVPCMLSCKIDSICKRHLSYRCRCATITKHRDGYRGKCIKKKLSNFNVNHKGCGMCLRQPIIIQRCDSLEPMNRPGMWPVKDAA